MAFAFDDWALLEELAGSDGPQPGGAGADLMERAVQRILDQDLPGAVDGERAYYDSEGDHMRLVVTRRPLARKIATALLTAWNTPERFAQAVQAELQEHGA